MTESTRIAQAIGALKRARKQVTRNRDYFGSRRKDVIRTPSARYSTQDATDAMTTAIVNLDFAITILEYFKLGTMEPEP